MEEGGTESETRIGNGVQVSSMSGREYTPHSLSLSLGIDAREMRNGCLFSDVSVESKVNSGTLSALNYG